MKARLARTNALGLDEQAMEHLADWIAENVPPSAARGALRIGAGADGSYV